jgi:hypothetical protein
MANHSNNDFGKAVLTKEYLEDLASKNASEAEKALLAELIAEKIVTQNDEGEYFYDETSNITDKILDLWKNTLHLFTQEEVNNVLSTAWTEVAA